MKKLIYFFPFLFFFSSCQKLKYGNVVEKWYEPSHIDIQYMLIPTGNNMTTLMPVTIFDGEDWCINVKGVGTEGDTITRTYYLTEEEYNKISIGKFICIEGSCDEDTNNKEVEK